MVLNTRGAYYWRTFSGAELDLMFIAGGKRYGIEYKNADAPSRSRSMLSAIQDLKLEHLWVVYPRGPEYALDQHITAVSLKSVAGLAQHVKRRRL